MISITRYMPDNIKQNLRHPGNAVKVYIQNLYTFLARLLLRSSSQHGEDFIIHYLLKFKKNGCYVDIGANDPEIISNTKYFYDIGWRGINIEPHPILFNKINQLRSQDVNLNVGIAQKEDSIEFFQIDEVDGTAGSTFDPQVAKELEKKGYTISKVVSTPVVPLKKSLAENLKNNKIDFMSIDTEGFDLEVLKSNDWKKYRPTFVLVEIVNNKDEINTFMYHNDYKKIFQNTANAIYKDNKN